MFIYFGLKLLYDSREMEVGKVSDELQEVEEERTAFAQISAGADVDIKPGQAHGLRLEEMQKLAQSPTAQRKMQQDPAFQENVIKRMKQHEHQLTQQQNAQIGRLGA